MYKVLFVDETNEITIINQVLQNNPQKWKCKTKDKMNETHLIIVNMMDKDSLDQIKNIKKPILGVLNIGDTFDNEILKQYNINDILRLPMDSYDIGMRLESICKLENNTNILAELFPYEFLKQVESSRSSNLCDSTDHVINDFIYHKHVAILFADIVQYTQISKILTAFETANLLNNLFDCFDTLCEKHKAFKVETIGDAYMVVSGHDGTHNCNLKILALAEDMVNKVSELQPSIMIRISLHSGSVCSGILGKTRPRYSFIGDAINTASRMESNGYPMCIHVSSEFVDNCKLKQYMFKCCGKKKIKGNGYMCTYLYMHKNQLWKKHIYSKMKQIFNKVKSLF